MPSLTFGLDVEVCTHAFLVVSTLSEYYAEKESPGQAGCSKPFLIYLDACTRGSSLADCMHGMCFVYILQSIDWQDSQHIYNVCSGAI